MFDSPRDRRLKILLASGLWAIALALFASVGCKTLASDPNAYVPRGTVIEAWQRPVQGDMKYFVKVQFDESEHVHSTFTININLMEWMQFGREGAPVCLYPYGRIWRLGKCKD